MKVRVDPDRCQGHARCMALLPHLFTSDDYGYAVVPDGTDIPGEMEPQVRQAMANCPEGAIILEEA